MIKKMVHLNCEFSVLPSPNNADIARLFMHGGHTNHLADFSWNQNEPWVVCSAAEDNLIQIWKVAEAIVGKDIEEPSLDELER
jgi:WD40 repeat protein